MTVLRRSAARRLRLARCGGALLAAGLGAAAVGGLAWSDGGAVLVPALLGGALAAAVAIRARPPWRDPALEIEPAADADGLLRAALAVPGAHPLAPRLLAEAARRKLRFRRAGEPVALAAFAGAALVWALWVAAAPWTGPGREEGGPREGVAGSRSARGTTGVASDQAVAGAAAPPDAAAAPLEGGAPGGAGEEGAGADGRADGAPGGAVPKESWGPVPIETSSGPGFVAGRDFGGAREAVERYLRSRAEERR